VLSKGVKLTGLAYPLVELCKVLLWVMLVSGVGVCPDIAPVLASIRVLLANAGAMLVSNRAMLLAMK
jgi:hypothetical protein